MVGSEASVASATHKTEPGWTDGWEIVSSGDELLATGAPSAYL